MEMTVAKFNSWYLGGIAHELGHGLGFPHDNGGPGEARGIPLMGDGNLHYREDQWGGRHPAYLSLATALRFAADPLLGNRMAVNAPLLELRGHLTRASSPANSAEVVSSGT